MEISRSGKQVRISFTHDDLTAAGTAQTISIPDAIPANHVVDKSIMFVDEAFDGDLPVFNMKDADGEASAVAEQSIAAATRFYQPAFQDDGGAVDSYELTANKYSETDAVDLQANFGLNSGQLDAVTTGELSVILLLSELSLGNG